MIHPTAIVDSKAEIASDASIGAYVIIEGPVKIGSGSTIHAHAHISGWTTLGEHCEVHPFAVVGNAPQDSHYEGQESYVVLSDRTVVREFATIHRGSQARSATMVGADCLIMAKAHIGHNCVLGEGVVISNSAECSGHVEIGEHTIISGHTLIHQFTRIGRRVMCTPCSRIRYDVPPFFLTEYSGGIATINAVGLKRAGFAQETISEIKQAYRSLYRSKLPFKEAVAQLSRSSHSREVQEILTFITAESKNGIAGPPTTNRRASQEMAPRHEVLISEP